MLAGSVFYLFLPRSLHTSKLMLLCIFLAANNSSSSRLAQPQGKINSPLSWLRNMVLYNTSCLHSSTFISIQCFSRFIFKHSGRKPAITEINDTSQSCRLKLVISSLALVAPKPWSQSESQMHYFLFLTESECCLLETQRGLKAIFTGAPKPKRWDKYLAQAYILLYGTKMYRTGWNSWWSALLGEIQKWWKEVEFYSV